MTKIRSPRNFRRFAYNTGTTFLRQLLAASAGLVLAIVLARMFGPSGNGQYNLAILLPTLLATLLNLGIGPATVYYVARGDISAERAAGANLRLWLALTSLGGLAATAILLFLSENLFPGVPRTLLSLAVVAFPLLLLQHFLGGLLQARQAFHLYNVTLLVPPLGTLALIPLLVLLLDWGLSGALLAFVTGQAMGVLVSAYALRRTESQASPSATESASAGIIRSLIGYGWKAHLSNILTFVNYRADIFLVNLFLAPVSVGLYVIAVQLAERLWILSNAASTILLPRLAELHGDRHYGATLTALVSKWVLGLSLVAAGLLVTFARPLVRLLFGDEYLDAVAALTWLLPGIVLGSSARVLANDLAARGKPELNMYAGALVVVVNIIANIILIPYYGIVGAALATTIAYSFNYAVKVALFARYSQTPWWKTIVPTPPGAGRLLQTGRPD